MYVYIYIYIIYIAFRKVRDGEFTYDNGHPGPNYYSYPRAPITKEKRMKWRAECQKGRRDQDEKFTRKHLKWMRSIQHNREPERDSKTPETPFKIYMRGKLDLLKEGKYKPGMSNQEFLEQIRLEWNAMTKRAKAQYKEIPTSSDNPNSLGKDLMFDNRRKCTVIESVNGREFCDLEKEAVWISKTVQDTWEGPKLEVGSLETIKHEAQGHIPDNNNNNNNHNNIKGEADSDIEIVGEFKKEGEDVNSSAVGN